MFTFADSYAQTAWSEPGYRLMVTLFTTSFNIQEFFLSAECIYVFCLGLAVWETAIFYYLTLADRFL